MGDMLDLGHSQSAAAAPPQSRRIPLAIRKG
jgi:hypothetical protein